MKVVGQVFKKLVIAGVLGVTTLGTVALAGSDLARVLPLIRADGMSSAQSSEKLARGTVKLDIKGTAQEVTIDVYSLPPSQYAASGLAVYLSNGLDLTNSTVAFVGVMDADGTNGHWRVTFANRNGAPPQLGDIDSLTELEGLYVLVGDSPATPVLAALITPLVPNLSSLKYSRRATLLQPAIPLSPKARAKIRVRYNPKTGGSILDLKATGLNAGNRYLAWSVDPEDYVPGEKIKTYLEDGVIPSCADSGFLAVKGKARYLHNTGLGDDLPHGGLAAEITTAGDLSGTYVEIVDCFGGLHLYGLIP